ncbi:unnamed protein product [Peniophora sp. CBMAI 1063]|nr:unnamed protein product [Peniophora sp. CBMAI 1063]
MTGLIINPAWAPAESHTDLVTERALFIGLVLAWGTWGILIVVTVFCVKVLRRNVRRGKTQRRFLMGYTLTIFLLSTTSLFLETKWTQTYLIDQRDYPGGPLGYYTKYDANPFASGDRICGAIVTCLADGLLIYRVCVIYQRRMFVVLLSILAFLTSLSMSIVELCAITSHSLVHSAQGTRLVLVSKSLSIAINILVTILIVTRLLAARRNLVKNLNGNAQQSGRLYINASAILVESATLYTVPAILFIIGFSLQDSLSVTADALLFIQAIASLLIILRVANGSAYSATTTNSSSDVSGSAEHGRSITSIRFAPSVQSTRSPYNGHYEMQDSKGIQLPMPAMFLDDPNKGAQNSASSIEPYPTFREVSRLPK